MAEILRADEIKADFEALKIRWDQMLSKYFLNPETIDEKYTIEIPCPHCDSSMIDESFLLNGFWHKTCSNCKTLYVSPRLNDACIEELYSDDYYSGFYAKSMLPLFETRKEKIGRRKFAQSVLHWGGDKPGRVLDIGAGIGEVTDVFHEQGWLSHATEMNSVAAEWLNQRGYEEVFHGPLDTYVTDNKFDVAMAWGVVEHVIDPDAFLQQVFELLKPGGLFVSEVPHGQSLLIDYSRKTGMDPKRILMGEQHIVLYSTDAYVALHERNGFKKVHLQTNGLDISTIFKECGETISDDVLAPFQACVDEKNYGDLLRGFWRKVS
jgi:SAM-dependent methyltransferase